MRGRGVGIASNDAQLDVAVELLEALVALQLLAVRDEQPIHECVRCG